MIASGVGWAGRLDSSPEFVLSWGQASENPSLYFDLASLTKVVVTGSLLVDLSCELKKDLSSFRRMKVCDFLPHAPDEIQKLNIGQLWDHRAGLIAHFDLVESKVRTRFSGERKELWQNVLGQIALRGLKPTFDCTYSDLSFWILGAVLESHYGRSLNELWQDFKRRNSLPLNDLVYSPVNVEVAPTESRHPTAQVNDDNAYYMQEVAPHAGLFSSAEALWDWMKLMSKWFELRPELRDYFAPQGEGRFWCGWDRPSELKTQAGEGAPTREVLGHLGFTGTALWWNPLTKWGGLLLTNRVFPSRSDQNQTEIRELRIKFFSLLWHNKRKELWKVLQEQVGKTTA